ncbi:MAG: 6-phosphogluconolactonase [Sorangiineae bacterium NIC37A_2]|jgi:6-phosphogluconolactonase|nr:MAG: 6-phosphogluconolactonase [Sorangiineae bacterium NIC37A_2]
MRSVAVLPDRTSLTRAVADRIVAVAEEAIRERGRFTWALSGGRTPSELYMLLASPEWSKRIDWSRVHFFWGDERCVPPDHRDSNYRMASDTLLSAVHAPPENVHRMRGELEPGEAASRYDRELRQTLEGELRNTFPRLDLVLLGMGADGHTASLFPGSLALTERERAVVATTVLVGGEMGAPASGVLARPGAGANQRLTLTLPMISAARTVVFLVAGADKASRLLDVLSGQHPGPPYPAELVRPEGGAQWFVDRAAHAKVDSGR